jgi:hypothetical protein
VEIPSSQTKHLCKKLLIEIFNLMTYGNAKNDTRQKCRNGKAALSPKCRKYFGLIGQTIENVVKGQFKQLVTL